jgi:hypothetical protein
LRAWCGLDQVIKAVVQHYECTEQELMRRHSKNNEARQVLLYLAVTYCRGRYTLTNGTRTTPRPDHGERNGKRPPDHGPSTT